MTIPLLGILAKAVKAGTRGTGSVLVGGALLTMTESWKQPQCPSVDERINRQQTLTQLQTGGAFGHTCYHMEEPEGIVLGEISQSQKEKYCMRTLEESNS